MNLHKKKPKAAGVAIIPLIDILAILLIFFVATTTFKKKQSVLKISPPEAGSLPTATVGKAERIPLSVAADGAMELGAEPVRPNGLTDALKALKAARPDAKLTFNADAKVDLEILLSVWNSMKEAGYQSSDAPLNVLKKPAAKP